MTVRNRHNTVCIAPVDTVKPQVIGYNGCRLGLAAEKHVPQACLPTSTFLGLTALGAVVMTHEEWRDVVGYEGYYQVSNLGRVRSVDRTIIDSNGHKKHYRGKTLKPSLKRTGYYSVTIHTEEVKKTVLVHRLVAAAFLEPDPKRLYVDHIDADKTNNKVDNLRWCTCRENINFAIENGNVDFRSFTESAKHSTKRRGNWCMTKIQRNDGKIYNSVTEASRDLGVTKSSIYKALDKQNKTCKGYTLKTVGKTSIREAQLSGATNNWYQMKHQARRVIRNDGKIFSSVSEAAREVGTSSGNMSAAIRKGQRCKGFRFSYIDETDKSKSA